MVVSSATSRTTDTTESTLDPPLPSLFRIELNILHREGRNFTIMCDATPHQSPQGQRNRRRSLGREQQHHMTSPDRHRRTGECSVDSRKPSTTQPRRMAAAGCCAGAAGGHQTAESAWRGVPDVAPEADAAGTPAHERAVQVAIEQTERAACMWWAHNTSGSTLASRHVPTHPSLGT